MKALTNSPIPASQNWGKPLKLHVNVAKFTAETTLAYDHGKGKSRKIYHKSKKMTANEKKYTGNGRELLALISDLQEFQYYLERPKFSVIKNSEAVGNFLPS